MNAGFLAELKQKAKATDGASAKTPKAAAAPPSANASLMEALKSKQKDQKTNKLGASESLMAALKARKPPAVGAASSQPAPAPAGNNQSRAGKKTAKKTSSFAEQPFEYHPCESNDGDASDDPADSGHGFFLFVSDGETSDDFVPRIDASNAGGGTTTTTIEVPLAPLVYRACDHTFEKAVRNKTAVAADECVRKLGILRALQRERGVFNDLLADRLAASNPLEEEELGKTRFLELLSNGGVARTVVELLLTEMARALDHPKPSSGSDDHNNDEDDRSPLAVSIAGLDDLLEAIEGAVPELAAARAEIEGTQSVSFYPGLGELFGPGAKLVCYPEGMEGSPLGVSCVQSWYAEDHNHATGTTKRRFVLVIEFLVSVGDELVFVAMTGALLVVFLCVCVFCCLSWNPRFLPIIYVQIFLH